MTLLWPWLLVFAPAVLLLTVVLALGGRRLLGGEQPAQRGVDWPLLAFVAVTGVAIVVGWVATTLATTGWFSLPALSLIIAMFAVVSGGLLWRLRKVRSGVLAPIGWQEAALGALLLAASLLYFRPHEYVLGGTDAGTYVNIASQVARTGNIVAVDEWTGFLSEYRDVTLRAQPAYWLTRYLQFVGWYIDDANPARTAPQFLPFHPALLAVGAGLFGPAGALFVTPLWGVLDIAALYFLARRLFDKNVALVASAFLTVTATQVFFARYPTTEPLTMLLVFTALLAFQVIWDERAAPWLWGVLGGAALGAALLTRIDLPLVLGLFILGMLIRCWQHRWNHAWTAFAAVLALLVLQLVSVVWQVNWPYFYNTYTAIGSLLRADSSVIAGVGLAMLLALGAATLLRPAALVNRVARLTAHPVFRWTLAVTVILLSFYAYFLRPVLEPAREFQSWPENTVGLVLNGENWLRMGWYLTPLGLFLATVGLVVIVMRRALPRMTVVLGVGVLTTLQYVYNILNAHYHIYAMRRYVPIVIPMLLLFAAVGALAFPLLKRRWITYSVRGLFVAGLTAGLLYQARFVLPQQDFAGALRQLGELRARLRPDALLLIPSPADSNFADTIGAPLHMIYGYDIATLRSDAPTGAAFLSALLDKADADGRAVQLISAGRLPTTVRENLDLEPVDSYTFSTQMLMNTYDDYPAALQGIYYGLEIYDVTASGDGRPGTTPSPPAALVIDIGAMDSAYLGEGFYAKELVEGQPTVRWTDAQAELYVRPEAASISSCARVAIAVQAMTYRPDSIAESPVVITVNDRRIGEFMPAHEWRTYVFEASPATIGSGPFFTIGLETSTFSPAELSASTDSRELGVVLDWVRISCAN